VDEFNVRLFCHGFLLVKSLDHGKVKPELIGRLYSSFGGSISLLRAGVFLEG
jgi:hypothetical protein